MEVSRTPLVHPRFVDDPGLQPHVDARPLGIVIATVAGIAGAIALITLPALIGIYASCDAYVGGCGTFHSTAVGSIGDLIATAALFTVAFGGYRLSQGYEAGRALVCCAIPVVLIADVITGIGFGVYFGLLTHVVVGAGVWYLTVMSAIRPLPAAGAAPMPPPPYPAAAPPVPISPVPAGPPLAVPPVAPAVPPAEQQQPIAMPPIPPTAPPLPQSPPPAGPPPLPPQA